MTEPAEPTSRRRRRSAGARQGAAGEPPQQQPAPAGRASRPLAKAKRARAGRDSGEHSLHDLVGSGPSQLGVEAALRGRDLNRPTEQDLAVAERDVVIVRRHWQPTP
jgi:hypothetical protein